MVVIVVVIVTPLFHSLLTKGRCSEVVMEAALRELLGRGAQLLRLGGFGFRVFWVALLRFQGLGFRV